MKKMTLKLAKEIAGNVTKANSKMTDSSSFGFDSFACYTGDKLAQVTGTSCSKCYARRLQKFRKNVDIAWKRNQSKALGALASGDLDAEVAWILAVAYQINHYGYKYHRWFDGGDLFGPKMLEGICRVAMLTPYTTHYVPTKEVGYVRSYLEFNYRPSNVVIRVSSPKVDGRPLNPTDDYLTSTVHKDKPYGFHCPAHKQENQCLDCKACWDIDVANISYPLH